MLVLCGVEMPFISYVTIVSISLREMFQRAFASILVIVVNESKLPRRVIIPEETSLFFNVLMYVASLDRPIDACTIHETATHQVGKGDISQLGCEPPNAFRGE